MNRIFKTVFSRSRGAMMVANELTKSHQVGKKAAVAVAVVGSLVFGVGSAAAGEVEQNVLETKEISESLQGFYVVNATSDPKGVVVTSTNANGNVFRGLPLSEKGEVQSKLTLSKDSKLTLIGGASDALSEGVVGGNNDNGYLEISGDGDLVLTITSGLNANAGIGHGKNIAIGVRSLSIDLSAVTPNGEHQHYGIFNEKADEHINVHTTGNIDIKAYGDAVYNNADKAQTTLTSVDGSVIVDGETGLRGLQGAIEVTGKNVQIGNTYSSEVRKGAIYAQNSGNISVTAQETLTIADKTKKTSAINIVDNAYVSLKANSIIIDGAIVSATKDSADKTKPSYIASNGTLEIKGGTVQLNGDVSKYQGTFKLTNGSVALDKTKNGNFGGNVVVNGGTFTAPDFAVAEGKTFTLAGGTLETYAKQVFNTGTGKILIDKDHTKVNVTSKDTVSLLSALTATSGKLALLDEGYYTNDSLSAMTSVLNDNVALSIANASLYKEADEEAELKDGFIQETENAVVKPTLPASSTDKSASVTVKNTGAQTVVIDDTSASSTATAPVIEKLEIKAAADTNFVLVGDQKNSSLLSLKSGAELKEVVFDDKVTVQIGSDNQKEQTSGTLPKTTVKNMNITNVKVAFEELKTKGDVSIGNNDKRGVVTTPTLNVVSGSNIFLAPIWVDGATMSDASQLEVTNGLDSSVDGNVIVGRNSVMTYGGTVAQAQQGLDDLGLKWGENDVSAALYIGHTLDVSTAGGVLVNGSLYQQNGVTLPPAGNGVELKDGSLLMINGSVIGDQAIKGALTATAKATVAVVNATDGKIKLADTVTGVTKVISDNQFVDASYKDGIITTDVNEQKLAGAIASLGIVQSARRADTVFANTIADRTAQSIAGEEVSLWADVGGERYEADDLDNKAQFKSNMFYGAFGADVGINPNVRIGAALQYGTGDSKSDNFNIKNDIDAVTLGLYGSYSFSESMKVVGEFAYTMSSNDIKSSERLLNNDVDADAFSLGVRGQYDYAVGAFRITPSVGLRLTRLCTDDFNVGGVKVDLDSQTLVQIPLSVAVSADIAQAGWTMKPYAKVSFTPSFGDDEINVRGYKQDALDTMPVQGDFGLSATNGNVTFGASLSAGFGQDGAQSFGGKVGIRYAF